MRFPVDEGLTMRERGWTRKLGVSEEPRLRVVCFPHSGGSASSFAKWADTLPSDVELIAIQYPGRGDRFGEQLIDSVAELAGHAVAELLRMPNQDQILFGHSLGAVVAFETALLLRDLGRQPEKLCISACLPPGRIANRDLHRAADEDFWPALTALGGIDARIVEDAELRELLGPTMRSDLRAHATYQPGNPTSPLSCPVICYHGDGDPLVDQRLLPKWADVTSAQFKLKIRPGGHFHVDSNVGELVSDVLGEKPHVQPSTEL